MLRTIARVTAKHVIAGGVVQIIRPTIAPLLSVWPTMTMMRGVMIQEN